MVGTGGAGNLSLGDLTAATFGGLPGNSNLVLSISSAAAVAISVGANNQSTTYSGTLTDNVLSLGTTPTRASERQSAVLLPCTRGNADR